MIACREFFQRNPLWHTGAKNHSATDWCEPNYSPEFRELLHTMSSLTHRTSHKTRHTSYAQVFSCRTAVSFLMLGPVLVSVGIASDCPFSRIGRFPPSINRSVSDQSVSPSVINLVAKGLKFIPTPQKQLTIRSLLRDFKGFQNRMRWSYIFSHSESKPIHPFYMKTNRDADPVTQSLSLFSTMSTRTLHIFAFVALETIFVRKNEMHLRL